MRKELLIVLVGVLVSLTGCVSIPQERLSPAIGSQELSDHVHFLAQPALKGRKPKTWESATARRYIKDRFEAYGLVPWLGTKGYEQSFGFGTNVIGVLPGSDPHLINEIVILSAHYDHVGKTKKGVLLGACDNASGVAALLEVAEKLSQLEKKPKRSICFASFDAEERMCLGAFAFTCREDYNDLKVSAIVNIDLLGRDFLDIVNNSLCVVGTDGYPNLQKQIIKTGANEGIKVLPFHSELIGPVGDHIAFISRERPVLFFSCGLYKDYHKPTDTADKLNYKQMKSTVLTISNSLLELANSEKIETKQQSDFENIGLKSTAYILDKLIEKRDVFDINEIDLEKVKRISDDLNDSLGQKLTKAKQVAKERKVLREVTDFLQNYDKVLAETGRGFIDISELYALDPEGFTNSFRETVKYFLKNKFSILFGIDYKYESEEKIANEDWAVTQTNDGQYFLGMMYKKLFIKVKKGFLKTDLSLESGFRGHFNNCKGSKEEIVDFCVMQIVGLNSPDTTNMPELAASLLEIQLRILNHLTTQYRNLSLEEIKDKHLRKKGFSSYEDWLVSLVDSNNPELAKGAIKFSKPSSDKIIDKLLTIIHNETVRADVREIAIRKLTGRRKMDVLMAISELLDSESLTRKKDYGLQFDEEFPLAEHPYILFFKKGIENWYDTEGKKHTIAKAAYDTLRKTTKKDFGRDKKAWRKWIKANVK